MEKIREQMKNPLVMGGAGLVIGLLIGWMLLGWVIFPVEYVDGAPENLAAAYQQDYLIMAVQSFNSLPDAAAAQQRWDLLGAAAKPAMEAVKTSGKLVPAQIDSFLLAVGETALPTPAVGVETTPTKAGAKSSTGSNIYILLGVLCVLILIVAAALVYLVVLRKKPGKTTGIPSPAQQAQVVSRAAERTNFSTQGQAPPVAQFMTTYVAGDDLFDDSFSIDSPSGEFLGECGVGISETIGVGDPKKVTAFEVWLFDKNDIQTVTKVLMSEHAFNDPAVKQRLEAKGEPVQAVSGERLVLETATLHLEAKVVEMNYGQGPLPAGSFFDRVTLELAIWPKAAPQA